MATAVPIQDPVLDWARVYDYQLRDGGGALAVRLRIWRDSQLRLGRRIVRERFGDPVFIVSRDGRDVDDITNQSDPPPGEIYWAYSGAVHLCSVVHTYKGEGLTACGLEVVGPCPDCAEVAT